MPRMKTCTTPATNPLVSFTVMLGVIFLLLALWAGTGVVGVAPGQRRRVFSLRYLGDDARHAPRRWTTSPDFPGLTDRLPPGAPMDDALFPLLVGGSP